MTESGMSKVGHHLQYQALLPLHLFPLVRRVDASDKSPPHSQVLHHFSLKSKFTLSIHLRSRGGYLEGSYVLRSRRCIVSIMLPDIIGPTMHLRDRNTYDPSRYPPLSSFLSSPFPSILSTLFPTYCSSLLIMTCLYHYTLNIKTK